MLLGWYSTLLRVAYLPLHDNHLAPVMWNLVRLSAHLSISISTSIRIAAGISAHVLKFVLFFDGASCLVFRRSFCLFYRSRKVAHIHCQLSGMFLGATMFDGQPARYCLSFLFVCLFALPHRCLFFCCFAVAVFASKSSAAASAGAG